eukprot:1457520-Pyramimonas_sp.AAC.1
MSAASVTTGCSSSACDISCLYLASKEDAFSIRSDSCASSGGIRRAKACARKVTTKRPESLPRRPRLSTRRRV